MYSCWVKLGLIRFIHQSIKILRSSGWIQFFFHGVTCYLFPKIPCVPVNQTLEGLLCPASWHMRSLSSRLIVCRRVLLDGKPPKSGQRLMVKADADFQHSYLNKCLANNSMSEKKGTSEMQNKINFQVKTIIQVRN